MKIVKLAAINPLIRSAHAHFLSFEIEQNKWNIVDNILECDIIPVLRTYNSKETNEQIEFIKPYYKNQIILILNLFHIDDNSDSHLSHSIQHREWAKLTNRVIIVHSNAAVTSNIYYDMLWNRQKLYCTEYDRINLKDRAWTWGASKKMYALAPIEKNIHCKKFLSPNRIYYKSPDHSRTIARNKLKTLLKNQDGYYSDPQNGEILNTEDTSIDFNGTLLQGNGGTWWPIANYYYQSSFVSIYVETLCINAAMKSITEKTWDPLIKGHFILPFGYQGMISDITQYGFKLPDWIDYSYDNITSYDDRWNAYVESVKKVLELTVTQLTELFYKDRSLLEYNRQIFFTRQYDTLYDKVYQLVVQSK